MTGYGVAFPRNSKHLTKFNKKVMDYSDNGKENTNKAVGKLSDLTAKGGEGGLDHRKNGLVLSSREIVSESYQTLLRGKK